MRAVLAAMSILLVSTLAAASPTEIPLRPGSYAITYSMEMNGQSLGKPAHPHPRCLERANLGDPEEVFSQNSYNGMGRNPQCKVTNLSGDGRKLAYDLACPRSTDHVEATVAGDSFEVTRSARGRTSTAVGVITKVDGKRVGDCRR